MLYEKQVNGSIIALTKGGITTYVIVILIKFTQSFFKI